MERGSRFPGTRIGIGVLTFALLMSGALVGIAQGIDAPEEIAIHSVGGVVSRDYPLRDGDGRRTGSLSSTKEQLADEDGNDVGYVRCSCFAAKNVAWHCTGVITLRSGPNTGAGTIVVTGLFRGFNGERLAVTGGTGDYANASGTATLSVEDNQFTWTLSLVP